MSFGAFEVSISIQDVKISILYMQLKKYQKSYS